MTYYKVFVKIVLSSFKLEVFFYVHVDISQLHFSVEWL